MRKNRKKVILLLLLSMMSLLLIRCGGSEKNLNDQQDNKNEYEYIYVPEFKTLELDSDMYLYNLIFEEEELYFISSTYDDQEGNVYKEALYRMSWATRVQEVLPIEVAEEDG